MNRGRLYERHRELQSYVGWSPEDARRVAAVGAPIDGRLPRLIDDFYEEIDRHPAARQVVTGGPPQIERLKGSLLIWVRELFSGPYDEEYVERRWRVGGRHAEIGLDQIYTNAALSRLRSGLVRAARETWRGNPRELDDAVESLNKLLDLDLAVIEDAYQAAHVDRLRRAEDERLALLRERSEATFRQLVETAECMIVILRLDGSIVYFSPFAERLTGYSAEEVRWRDYRRLFLPEKVREAVADEFARVLDGRPTPGFENQVVCRDGSRRWMTWNACRLADFQGAPALLKVGQDVTYMKQAQERALQAERLAAIGQVAAGLAHEGRNALQRGQACLEMLSLTVCDRPESLDLIARAQKAQDLLLRLYEDVRGYAAPIMLQRRPCDLGEVWREAWAHLGPSLAGRTAALRERDAGADLRCLADPARLGQVFDNLFDNALAAAPDPAEVEVSVEDVGGPGRPLRVGVRDNGPGLTPEQRRRIFEPFYTTKTKGTGLGLAIARRIVEAHGGGIAVADDGAPGAFFLITLPRGTP